MWFRHFVWKCFPVLPLVYDDTLSFYELLSKMGKKINEIISGLLEMKVVVDRNSDAVLSVNNTKPDDNGNVNLSQVSGVTSVCGVGADGQGNVPLVADNVGAVSKTSTAIVPNILTLNSELDVGYAYAMTNSLMGYLCSAFKFPNNTTFTIIDHIFNHQAEWGFEVASIEGNIFGLPTQSYSSTLATLSSMMGHCLALPNPIVDDTTVIGELTAVIIFDGTYTKFLITGGYIDNFKELLKNRSCFFNGVILKQVT